MGIYIKSWIEDAAQVVIPQIYSDNGAPMVNNRGEIKIFLILLRNI
ncbi:MAG: hypothetical protein CM15mP111_0930 [Hyphomicrobiales bacterium]|nr:MAG: hypothetical protein CM15mP111_0930 [Hyphomicrobiales bacterium]